MSGFDAPHVDIPFVGLNESPPSFRFTTAATSGDILVSYLFHTTIPLPIGLYCADVTFFIQGSAANTQIRIELEIDGQSFSGPIQETGIADGRLVFSGKIPFPVTVPNLTHTIELLFSVDGGSGTATALDATIMSYQIGEL